MKAIKTIWRSVRSTLRFIRYPIAILLWALGLAASIGGEPNGGYFAFAGIVLTGLFYWLDHRRRNRARASKRKR